MGAEASLTINTTHNCSFRKYKWTLPITGGVGEEEMMDEKH